MKYIYRNTEKQINITEFKKDSEKTMYEKIGYNYALSNISYSVLELNNKIYIITNDSLDNYYKWSLYIDNDLIIQGCKKSDILHYLENNELNK